MTARDDQEASPKPCDQQLDFLIDFITHDDRPTLLLDTRTRRIVFCNTALDSLLQHSPARDHLQAWSEGLCSVADRPHTAIFPLGSFAQEQWLGKSLASSWMTVFCRWKPASHVQHGHATSPDEPPTNSIDTIHADHDASSEAQRLTDMHMGWLEPSDDPWMSFVRNYDFDNTAIGPVSSWHPQLRRAVQRMMVCPETRILYWGDQMAMIYNEAAIPVLGQRHPCLGLPLAETWGQAMRDQIVETIKSVVVSGKAYQARDVMFVLERDGFPEQTWHHFYQLPITDSDGRYLGCVCEFSENTTGVIQENRAAVLDSWIKTAVSATALPQLWSTSCNTLGKNSIDIVAGCVYSVASNAHDPDSQELPLDIQDFNLEAHFGLSNVQSRPPSGLLKLLKTVPDFESLAVFRKEVDELPADLLWDIPDYGTLRTVCVISITDLNNRRLAVGIFGMNPKRPFDDGSRSFVSSIADLLRKSAIFITLPEEQRKNEAITSALSDTLQVALLKAEKQEEAYARMASHAPIGMYMVRPDGYPIFVNDAFLGLHGTTRAQFYKNADSGLPWVPSVYEEDLALVDDMWRSTIEGKKPVQGELRFKVPVESSPEKVRWVESMSYAERDASGNVTSVQGWLLDVSQRKLSERLINEKLQDALETKRATESFLDMLSHETRNPLSAILQLADGLSALAEDPSRPDGVESLADSAQTITLCAKHMKTMMDEVLTFSKLDSNLVVLSLEKAQVPPIIEMALKMFEVEIEHANINACMNVEQSYADLDIDYVWLDPSRLLQVIINFLTNSIKFTKDKKDKRNITIRLGASTTKPTEKDFGIAFLPPRKESDEDHSMTTQPSASSALQEWAASKEELYIYIGVEDTGQGLTEEECKALFQRFAQASPRTYKTYGGSGLGLFISRGLSELQGGQIGVKSAAGVGSTFAFFVKTQRVSPPTVSRSQSIVSTEAMTDVVNLRHKDGEPDVKILTMSSVSEISSTVSVEDLHILVCEDNAINQKVIAQQLRRLGVNTVHVADDGLVALDFLATTTYTPSSRSSIPLSVILMDVEMPNLDGLSCVRRIRKLESEGKISGHVPIIAITANARNEQVATALEAGMDEVVTKPFLVRELIPRMIALVQKYRYGGKDIDGV